jgi:hypothetical protein
LASGGIHLVAGFALGSHCRSVPAALVAGVVSHGVLDAMPHRDYRYLAAHISDGAVGIGLTGLLWRRCASERRRYGLAGAIAAILPDVENVLVLLDMMDREGVRFPSHSGLIRHGRANALQTLLIYTIVVAACWATVRRPRQVTAA